MGKEIQHKKIKNTGILFELLTRQLTSDILNGREKSAAKELIQKHFGSKTELGKEYSLYKSLVKQKFVANESKSLAFIDEVIAAHCRLNKSELRKAKYNLIKEIKENYTMDDFFKNRIDNYKLLASIYKLFQSKSIGDDYSPSEIVESKFTILEHIVSVDEEITKADMDMVLNEYGKLNKDVRLLAYKIMIDKFNEKYKVLNEGQRRLIREYINNISSADSLREYILEQLKSVKAELGNLVDGVTNQVSKIKVTEVLKQLENINESTTITDNHIMAMLNIYELIDELKKQPQQEKS